MTVGSASDAAEADPDALRQAAESGDAEACFRYGLLLMKGGAGRATDPAEAMRWCERAARAGLGAAQFNLGLLLTAGAGVEADAEAAARWLRLAAINGIPEAEACLDLVHGGPAEEAGRRPRTWDEAETRASVALERSDPEARKSLRFADYYVDPCIDLLARRYRLGRDAAEDIVQQFFLKMEEPLSRGEHRGRQWKESMRARYRSDRGAFRPFLGRVLLNFARDCLRRGRTPDPAPVPVGADDPYVLDRHAVDWRAALERFHAEVAAQRADAATACRAVLLIIGDGLGQAEAAARLAISERTLRNHLRLGGELLREWVAMRLAERGGDDPVAVGLREGLRLLPDWLHYPSAEKRVKTLLLLALLMHRRE